MATIGSMQLSLSSIFLAIELILLGLPHLLFDTPSIPYYRLKRPSQLLEGDQGQESVTHQNLVFRRV